MRRNLLFVIVVASLISSTLGCGFSFDLGLATSTPSLSPSSTPLPPTAAPPTPTPQALATEASTPTSQPTPTPAPPEVISSKNVNRLSLHRGFGIGALIKVQPSPDGKFILLVYSTRIVMIDAESLAVQWEADPGYCLFDAVFSKDQKKIVALAIGGSLHLYNAADGSLLASPAPQSKSLAYIALSPGGGWAAYTDLTGVTRVVDAISGAPVSTNNGQAYPGGISGMLLSPDEQTLLIDGFDSVPRNQVQQWDVSTGKYRIGLVGLPPIITAWKYSPDGSRLFGINPKSLTAEPSTVLMVWNTISGALVKTYPKGDLIHQYQISPDGKTILIATDGGELKLIDSQDGTVTGSFAGHKSEIGGMAFLPDGQSVISLDAAGTLIRWDTFTRKAINSVEGTPGNSAIPAAFASAAPHAALASPDGAFVGILNTDTMEPELKLGSGNAFYTGVAISSRANYAAAVDTKNVIHVWKLSDGSQLQTIAAVTRFPIRKIIFSPDESAISSLSDGQILTWDVASGAKMKDLAGMLAFDYSPDSLSIASDSTDSNLYIGEPKTGKLKASIPGERITSINYSPDGRLIAVGAQKIQPKERGIVNLIYQIDLQTKEKLPVEINDDPAFFADTAYSPSGDMLASADWQGNVVIWSLRDGKLLSVFEEITFPPASLKWNVDGTLLYVASGDGTIAYIAANPAGETAQAPSEVPSAPAATPKPGAQASTPLPLKSYSHTKGLLTVDLPAGWKVAEKDSSINVADPNSAGGIAISAIHTITDLTPEMFTQYVQGEEADFASSVSGYTETNKMIDGENGGASVTKKVIINNEEYIWQTDYARDGLLIYVINFLAPAKSFDAQKSTFAAVEDSVKVEKDYVLKQMPYGVTKTYTDPDGSFSFEVPLGWTSATDNQTDTDPIVLSTVYTSPENSATLTSVTVEGQKEWDDAMEKTVFESFPRNLDPNVKITYQPKTAAGDSVIKFESPNKFKGVGLSSNFGTKLHIWYFIYPAEIEQAILPLQKYLMASFNK